jgi:hypothetical protein
MPKQLECGAALSILLAVAGCGGADDPSATSGSASASTCAFQSPVPEAPPDAGYYDYDTPVAKQAKTAGLALLDGYVGKYLRGDSTVYRGTMSAHDNQSVLDESISGTSGHTHDQSVPLGIAVASLTLAGDTATLAVHGVTSLKFVDLWQDTKSPSTTTSVGIILGDGESGGNSGTCSGCVPSFIARPPTIDFANIESTQVVNLTSGIGTRAHDVTLHTYATAHLTLVTPCELTFEDIAGLSGVAFTPQGDDMVSEFHGSAYSEDEYCGIAYYTIDLYINAANLADYGVRNFHQTAPDGGCGGAP